MVDMLSTSAVIFFLAHTACFEEFLQDFLDQRFSDAAPNQVPPVLSRSGPSTPAGNRPNSTPLHNIGIADIATEITIRI